MYTTDPSTRKKTQAPLRQAFSDKSPSLNMPIPWPPSLGIVVHHIKRIT